MADSFGEGCLEDATRGLKEVRARILRAERDSARPSGSTRLVCVSKTFGPEAIQPILQSGERIFGENRVQEAKAKWPKLKSIFPNVELHLIGPLQSNKVREAVELFDVIETVDRPKIAQALAAEFHRSGRTVRLYVEINIGQEAQKSGVGPNEADAFVHHLRHELCLTIDGVMCIPPEKGLRSPYFSLLAAIAKRNDLPVISMGMSADFETAIHCGATHVRVGSAIFGQRPSVAG